MAREKLVTRTFDVSNFEVMECDTKTGTVRTGVYQLPGVYKDADALKALKKEYEHGTTVLVAVQSNTVTTTLYGMPESEFIRLAKILPPRGTTSKE